MTLPSLRGIVLPSFQQQEQERRYERLRLRREKMKEILGAATIVQNEETTWSPKAKTISTRPHNLIINSEEKIQFT